MAKASWRCPAAAWLSQLVIAAGIRPSSFVFYVLVAVAQGVLIVAGLILGIAALVAVARGADEDARKPAIFGIMVSLVSLVVVLLALKYGG